MSTLYLVHLPIDLEKLARWASTRDSAWMQWKDARGQELTAFDEGRALHHLLGETFGRRAMQPFRLMVSAGNRHGNLYAYSPFDASALKRTARELALPDALAICEPERLATKAMPQDWAEGKRLAFDLRVRPVRRLLKPAGTFKKGAELDAFLVEALRLFPEGPPDEADGQVARSETYAMWLARRIGDAARLENARLVRFERSRAARQGHASEGPDATMHGELVVQDSAAFAELLASGVGRHTAYGYGMLLLRPPGSG